MKIKNDDDLTIQIQYYILIKNRRSKKKIFYQ